MCYRQQLIFVKVNICWHSLVTYCRVSNFQQLLAVWLKSPLTPATVIKSPNRSETYQRMLLITVMTDSSYVSLQDHPNKVQKLVNIHFMLINSSDCCTCLCSWYGLLCMVSGVGDDFSQTQLLVVVTSVHKNDGPAARSAALTHRLSSLQVNSSQVYFFNSRIHKTAKLHNT